jgi:hypothetical protein
MSFAGRERSLHESNFYTAMVDVSAKRCIRTGRQTLTEHILVFWTLIAVSVVPSKLNIFIYAQYAIIQSNLYTYSPLLPSLSAPSSST